MGAERRAQAAGAEFRWAVRVYYEDTDATGLVYHSTYLEFMERARTEWLRHLGHGQHDLRSKTGIVFVVRDLEVRFMRPARIDQLLEVTVRITRCRGASMRFEQTVHDGETGPLCRALVEVACIDAVTLKPRRLPDFIKEGLKHVH
ncbi:MAG: tol-pal system-associated acyl-CoA thioesterase [Gammaproteobacteria bacterium]|nr:tol-pal system-associated acyl-CoA thioesterase [Gammaproteobacteria bacterium]